MKQIRHWMALLRVQQWVKNGFVLVGLFFGQLVGDVQAIVTSAAATAVFCCVSSLVYVLNDWRDRHDDALHPVKRNRPLASGALNGFHALIGAAVMVLVITGLFYALDLNASFAGILLFYVAINILYSLGLKRVTLLELVMVASGYVLRLVAGIYVLNLVPSPWILIATGALAFLLISGKRRVEFQKLGDQSPRITLQTYTPQLLDIFMIISASVAILSYILFSISDYAIQTYGTYQLSFCSVFVAYGIFRFLQLVETEKAAEDPVITLTFDRHIQVTVVLFTLTCGFIIYA